MTAIAPTGVGTLFSSADIAQASGLREDLVVRFVPGVDGPSGRMYTADRITVAVLVKDLTTAGAPAAAIDAQVRDFFTQPPAPLPRFTAKPAAVTRRTMWSAVGGTAAAAMLIGGLLGGLLNSPSNSIGVLPASTVTAAAPTPELDPIVPAAPDPVCAKWAPIADAGHAATVEWGSKGGDPGLPASSWTPEQRALNENTVGILQRQSQDLRRLADESSDKFLAALLRAQANYQAQFASRLMTYTPSDQALWQAALDYGAAIRSTCKTVAR